MSTTSQNTGQGENMMTRRWFLKLLSALAPLFGIKAEEVEADQTCCGKQVVDKTPVEPEVNELLARCRVPGTLTAAVLNAGHIVSVSSNVSMKGEFEHINEPRDGKVWTTDNGVTYTLHALPLPKLNTVEKVEAATLGIDKDYSDPHQVWGVFNHPNAMKCSIKITDSLWINVMKMREMAIAKKFYGSFALVHPDEWNRDEQSIQQVKSAMNVEGIQCCVGIKSRAPFDLALVQLTPDVIQMIVCHDRIVPRIRSDMHGNCGIVIAEEQS
jgi:hypothetical protein